jgi:hypothetical protein
MWLFESVVAGKSRNAEELPSMQPKSARPEGCRETNRSCDFCGGFEVVPIEAADPPRMRAYRSCVRPSGPAPCVRPLAPTISTRE